MKNHKPIDLSRSEAFKKTFTPIWNDIEKKVIKQREEQFGKYLTVILKKMCSYVHVKYEDIDFKKDGWYHQYCWTPEKEKKFVDWMTDFLYNNVKARKEIMSFGLKSKTRCKECALQFVAWYGWKTCK